MTTLIPPAAPTAIALAAAAFHRYVLPALINRDHDDNHGTRSR